MARRVETIVTLTDDIDGSKADRTVSFTVDGTSYEIDLSKRNATAFAKVLAPYVEAARKVKASRGRRTPRSSAGKRSDLTEIRAWAKSNGYTVGDKGRIPAVILDAYEAAR